MKNAKEIIVAYLQDIKPNLSYLAKVLKIPKYALAHWVRNPEKYNLKREHFPKLLYWCLCKGIRLQPYQGDYVYSVTLKNQSEIINIGTPLKIFCLNGNTHEYTAAQLWGTSKDHEGEQIFQYKNLCSYDFL
jgi:hypothetical protein